MKLREPLNSQILQKQFADVYQALFSKCQIVASAPHFFTWSGEFIGYFGGTMLLQKMPLRCYLGLEILPSGDSEQKVILADDLKTYSLKEAKFVKDKLEHSSQEGLCKFLNDYHVKVKGKGVLKIHILSEIPFGGSGSAAALSSALALALEEFLNKSKKAIQPASVFELACSIMGSYRSGRISGATIFNCLHHSAYPIFYRLKKNNGFPLKAAGPVNEAKRIDFQAGSLEELFALPQKASWPIDFGLLYIGEPRGAAPFPTGQLKDEMEAAASFFKRKSAWGSGLEVMNFLSEQVVLRLGRVLEKGARQDGLRQLFEAVNKHQILFQLFGFVPNNIDYLSALLKNQAKQSDELGAGLKSVSTTKKDVLFFVLPYGRGPQMLEEAVSKIKKELSLDVYLGYASWLDGIEKTGAEIEQNLTKKVFSPFISAETILIKEFSGQGRGEESRLLLSAQEFAKQNKSVDLLIEKNRLFLRGQPATSKEIHSSKATIGLLKHLLAKPNKTVYNRELPLSAYSKDRYELQSKIALPLLKLFKKRTKKDLPLAVKGAITDFSVSLEKGDYTIWLCQKP